MKSRLMSVLLFLWPCLAIAQERLVERIPTSFVENGRPVELELILFLPAGSGPFPIVLFHHGSTGRGDNPSTFRNTIAPGAVAKFLNDRGWAAAFPQRRGRGKSDGLYDEGFEPDRSSYSCTPKLALAGIERAVSDIDAALAYLQSRSGLDGKRIISAGVSRGGILALTHAARNPEAYLGAINWVGGWMTDSCFNPEAINTITFKEAGKYPGPTIWIYGENDALYSMRHSRRNHSAYVEAGGRATFLAFDMGSGQNGHIILSRPQYWQEPVTEFLGKLKATP